MRHDPLLSQAPWAADGMVARSCKREQARFIGGFNPAESAVPHV